MKKEERLSHSQKGGREWAVTRRRDGNEHQKESSSHIFPHCTETDWFKLRTSEGFRRNPSRCSQPTGSEGLVLLSQKSAEIVTRSKNRKSPRQQVLTVATNDLTGSKSSLAFIYLF